MSQKIVSQLTALNPLDGRYRATIENLTETFSEFALIKTRIEIEAKYLIALSTAGVIREMTEEEKELSLSYVKDLSIEEAEKVKKLEEETRHDVKAMERVFRARLETTSLADLIESVHLGLTSEDINNIAYRLMLLRSSERSLIPALSTIANELADKATAYSETAMLARTHGQSAVPTTLGKELSIYAVRLTRQIKKLMEQKLTGKLTGAVGNFNALSVTYPDLDWVEFSKKFIASTGLSPNIYTTQINPADDFAEYFQNIQRINNIILDFDQDMWRYISDGWFVQENVKGEVGSSTMPQKVNPIDFENSEGNLGMANALLEFMARKLPVSRLQRDLSDSTVLRNIGTALGYSFMGYSSTIKGLSRVIANESEIDRELNLDWVILTEAVQTILRKYKVKDAYTLVASLSRGKHVKEEEWNTWIESLPVDETAKEELRQLSPRKYVGLSKELTDRAVKEVKGE